MTFTHLPACQRRRGPGPAAAVHIAPCSCACSLDSARFGSACRSRQLARIKAESSAPPSAPWHQSGLAMHKAPLQTLLMLVQQTQTVLHCHEWSFVPPTPSAASRAAACRVLLLRHSPATATPLAVIFPRSVGGVAVISLWIFRVLLKCPLNTCHQQVGYTLSRKQSVVTC